MKGGGRGRSEPPSRQAACPERGPDGSPTWPSPPGNLKCERAAGGRGGGEENMLEEEEGH